MGNELDVRPIIEPDEIIWENLAYTGDDQAIRRIIMQLISLIFLILTIIFTMYIKGTSKLVESEVPTPVCEKSVNIKDADAYKELIVAKGSSLIGCYCKQNIPIWKIWVLFPHNFAKAQEALVRQGVLPQKSNKRPDKTNYCLIFYLE